MGRWLARGAALLGFGFVAAVAGAESGAGAVRAGQPWHEQAYVVQALAEASFQGMATINPAFGLPYGAYTALELTRKAADTRVTDANLEASRDLLLVDADAAKYRAWIDQGRAPADDPEMRALAGSLRQRAISLAGNEAQFIGRALYDRRTLYVATRNYAGGKLFGKLGGGIARLLGVRQATPVLQVSMKGVTGRFRQAEWKVIRHIARRTDVLSEKMAKVLISKLLSKMFDEVAGKQMDAAVQDFMARHPSRTVTRGGNDMFRLRLVEAAPLYLPVAAVAAAPAPQAATAAPVMVLRRAEDPVVDYASVQNQIVHHYEVEVHQTTATEQADDRDYYQDRGSHIPPVRLPSGPINWDGSRF